MIRLPLKSDGSLVMKSDKNKIKQPFTALSQRQSPLVGDNRGYH